MTGIIFLIRTQSTMSKPSQPSITGVILAGGRARRMGEMDKGLIELNGKPLIEYAIAALTPQVEHSVINANRNVERYLTYGLPVIRDEADDFQGPLAGMLSGMRAVDTDYILTTPCDCPLLPGDYARRMVAALQHTGAMVCVAHDGAAIQPVCALLSCALADDLHNYLASGGRKVETWMLNHHPAQADFADQRQAFLNINTPDDIVMMERQLMAASSC